MIGFSIMIWFAAFLLFVISISLFRKNTSLMHGKVYETTNDKVGYGKALGKLILFISFGMVICGIAALFSGAAGFGYALAILVIVVIIAAIGFIKIQKKY